MKFKVGDKVKCVEDGLTGILKTECSQCKWHVTMNDGDVRQIYSEDEIKFIPRTIMEVEVGDIITHHGYNGENDSVVLAVGEQGFARTRWGLMEQYYLGEWVSFTNANKYIIKGQEKTVEMTMEEVCKELGRNIKIIKENYV